MEVPFVDLKLQYRRHKKDIDRALRRVVTSARFIGGPQVAQFEKKFASYIGAKHAVGVNSGTDALILGMRALNLTPGDEVVIPVHTFIATALGATECGLRPVFVDMDPDDYGINLADLRKKITRKTKAIIAVHLFGQPDKIDEIRKIIRATGRRIHLIEDACQAHGARYRGKRVGTFGTFGAFSFYPGKNLGAYGDGGALVTNSAALAKRMRLLREYGQKKKYVHEILGTNSRLDTMQAAVLLAKLPHLDTWNRQRQQRAAYYTKHLPTTVATPRTLRDRKSVYHLYVIQAAKRDILQKFLSRRGITTLIHYPIPLHLQGAFRALGYKRGDFPHAEAFARRILSLPMYPELTDRQADKVIRAVKAFYEN
jgi:dTDP-4-amino-4,6-dideoxygalactose transaminase